MILAPPQSANLPAGAGVTLDRLFGYAAAQRGDDIALIDPPNRDAFTTGAPRTLTYREADRAVTAIAALTRPCSESSRRSAWVRRTRVIDRLII